MQDSPFFFRPMENDGNKSQIEQYGQYPRQPVELTLRILIFQQDAQSDFRQKNAPYQLIQVLQLLSLVFGNSKAVFIYHSHNQQNRSQVGYVSHPCKKNPDVRMNPFILIQKEFVINLHGDINFKIGQT